MADEQSTQYYFEIEVVGEDAARKAAKIQEKLTKALTKSIKPTKSLAEAFGELDKRINVTNARIEKTLSMLPKEIKRFAAEFTKNVPVQLSLGLKIVEKSTSDMVQGVLAGFQEMSDKVVGKSIVVDMVKKIIAEFDKIEAKTGVTGKVLQDHIEAVRNVMAEFYTIPWSEGIEKRFRSFARGLISDAAKMQDQLKTLTDLQKMFPGIRVGAGAVPIAPLPTPVVPDTFGQQIRKWSDDFTKSVQEVSIGTWGLRRMGFMFTRLGSDIEASGKKITSALMSMVNSYLEFNGVMAKTGASIGLTADATADLSDEIIKAAKSIGFIAPEKIAAGWEAWAQAQGAAIDTEEQRNKVLAQSIEITKLAEMRNADLGNTTDTVSGIMTVFNKDVGDLNSILAQMNYAAAKSSMTLGDFGSMMRDVGPIAEDMGNKFEDMIAMQLLFAKANIRGTKAVQATRSIFRSMAAPSDDFTNAMNNLVGITEEAAAAGFNWLQIYEGRLPTIIEFTALLARHVVDLTERERQNLYAILATSRGQAGLTVLVNAQIEAQKRGADAFQEAMVSNQEAIDFLAKTWSEYEKQDNVRAQTIKQRWDDIARTIGKSLTEAFIEPAEKASELLDDLGEFLEKYPGLATGALGVGAGAAVFGKLVEGFGQLLQIMLMLKMLAGTGALSILFGGAGAVGIPLLALGGLVGGAAYRQVRLETAGTEEAREFFEREFEIRGVPRANIQLMRPLTPLAEQLLGKPEEVYSVREYEELLGRIIEHLNEIRRIQAAYTGEAPLGSQLYGGVAYPIAPPGGPSITTETGRRIPTSAIDAFKSRMMQFVTDIKELEDTYRHDSLRLTEQAEERKLSVIKSYDEKEIAAEISLERQLKSIRISYNASMERAQASHDTRMEQAKANHHKALIRAEEDFVRQMARADDDYARSEARAQEDFDAQRIKSRKQYQDNEARDAERFKLRMERLEKDHVDKLRGIIRERDARGFIEEMLSFARRKKEAQEDYDIRRRDARAAQAEQEADAQANYDRARRRAKEDYERQRKLAKEQYEFARARRIADYEDQKKLMIAALAEQMRLIGAAASDRHNTAVVEAERAKRDREEAERKELKSIDDNLAEQLTKLENALIKQRAETWLHFWGIEGLLNMRDQFTAKEFEAIKNAHADEKFFYENTVLTDTKTIWGKIFAAVSAEQAKIMRKAAEARAAYLEILNLVALSGSDTGGTPKQVGGYASYGTYKLGESGREFILSNMTTRALENRVGPLTQESVLSLGSGGSSKQAPVTVILRQENWHFAGALTAAEKAELRTMARIGALEAFDEVTQKAWG